MKCQSVVLCDEQCEEHMPKFFNFINSTELKHQMSDKFKSFSEGLRQSEEQKKLKNKTALCETLKLFGTCPASHCAWRHMVNKDLDISDHLPHSGKIKFKIIYIHDVTAYSVQLIQHIDMEGKVREFVDNPAIEEELTSVIRVSRKHITNPEIGQQYAYYDIDESDGVYYRCILLEIERGGLVKLKLIDKGNIIKTNRNRLFKLPKEFKNIPRKIVDAYLANFTPPYHDENFSAKSFFNLKTLLEKHDYKNMIMTADIHLQIGDTLWLKNVYEEVTLSEKVIPRFQLTRELLVSKLAEYSNNQLNNLYKLCNEASISLPIYEKLIKRSIREEKNVEPQWAHLENEVNEVTFTVAISPDEIYVRLNKFNEQLYNLQKEIQENLKRVNYPKLQKVEKGTICLAKDPGGVDYARATVKNVEDGKALCFFVDFGDETVVDISELKYIHNKHITKLPFQSIQCRLHGIKPVLDEWQSDIDNILYEYATEPGSDVFRLLFVKTCRKEENIEHPKQNRYSVLLKDGFGEKRTLINSLLIDCGLAIPNSEQIDDFDISSSDFNSDESDEELEKIIDICRKTKEAEENVYINDDQPAKKDIVNEDMELFLIDAEAFFKSLLAGKNDVKSQSNRELPAIQAAPAVDYCTPEVYWSQTEKYIKIDIKLHDVGQYILNLTKGTILNFRTEKNKKTYKLNVMLYQKVSSLQHTAMGAQIRITLSKVNVVEWPRLTLSKQRPRNIHYDVSTITVEENDHKKILELPDMSDEEEEPDNDNIDVMYHVVSDIDSDMDADLADDSD